MKTVTIQIDKQAPFTITIGDAEMLALAHDLLNVDTWLAHAFASIAQNKIDRCFERMKKDGMKALEAAGVAMIPVSSAEFLALVAAQPGYENRAARQAREDRDIRKLIAENLARRGKSPEAVQTRLVRMGADPAEIADVLSKLPAPVESKR